MSKNPKLEKVAGSLRKYRSVSNRNPICLVPAQFDLFTSFISSLPLLILKLQEDDLDLKGLGN